MGWTHIPEPVHECDLPREDLPPVGQYPARWRCEVCGRQYEVTCSQWSYRYEGPWVVHFAPQVDFAPIADPNLAKPRFSGSSFHHPDPGDPPAHFPPKGYRPPKPPVINPTSPIAPRKGWKRKEDR